MTRAEILRRTARRVRDIEPDIAHAILVAIAEIRAAATLALIERFLAAGDTAGLVVAITESPEAQAALRAYADKLRDAFNRGGTLLEPEVRAVRVRRPPGTVTTFGTPPPKLLAQFKFDYLNPRVIDAIREYKGTGLSTFTKSVQDGIRVAAEKGLTAGVNPTHVTSREIRELVGLGPTQVKEVQNYRDALSGVKGRKPLDYEARNRRYDGIIKRGEKLTPEQIEKAVEDYRRRRIALNANAVARTNAHDALKAAQRSVWQQAVDEGRVPANRMIYTWHTAKDRRVRDEHAAMEGATRTHDGVYSDGSGFPGQNSYGCRCYETAQVV